MKFYDAWEELRAIAKEYNVAIITARQMPRNGYTPLVDHDPNGIIVIDYIGLLR